MEEVSHVLWAHRTMIKSSNGDTSFSLTYGTEAVISAEIRMPTFRIAEVNMAKNDEALEINLELLEEKRDQAAIKEERTMKQAVWKTLESWDPNGKAHMRSRKH
ncbi:hypothetical protein Tco_1327785 [Tanacetum coccineum]